MSHFLGKCIVNKDDALDVIDEIIAKMPDELKQAKWVKEERQRILVEAQKEAEGVVKEAENRIIAMVDENEITRKAYEQKNEKFCRLCDHFLFISCSFVHFTSMDDSLGLHFSEIKGAFPGK